MSGSTVWIAAKVPVIESDQGSEPDPRYRQVGTTPDGRPILHAAPGSTDPGPDAEPVLVGPKWRWSDLPAFRPDIAPRVLETAVLVTGAKGEQVLVREKSFETLTRPTREGDPGKVRAILDPSLPPHQWLGENR